MNIATLKRTGALTARLEAAPAPLVSFGCEAVDAACGGGLAAGAHQFAGTGAAPLGFGLALMARALAAPEARGLVVQAREAFAETGHAYAPGLLALGLDPDRIGLVEVRTEAEALRVVDEALRSGAVAAVLAELGQAPRLDLSITRRFNLSTRRSPALALMLTRDLGATSAALTRWRVEPRPSRGRRRRLGRPAYGLSLMRNRLGPTGEWTLEWDNDDRLFRPAPPLSAPVARPSADRPDPARPAAAGLPAGPYRQAG
jgi:protein ImuA